MKKINPKHLTLCMVGLFILSIHPQAKAQEPLQTASSSKLECSCSMDFSGAGQVQAYSPEWRAGIFSATTTGKNCATASIIRNDINGTGVFGCLAGHKGSTDALSVVPFGTLRVKLLQPVDSYQGFVPYSDVQFSSQGN